MKLRNLLEEFADSFKGTNKHIEVFKNPSKKEMNSVSETIKGETYIRFIAHKKAKDVYVFSPLEYHAVVGNKLNLSDKHTDLWGVALFNKKINKWEIDSSDTRSYMGIEEDFKWINKWIVFDPHTQVLSSQGKNPLDFKHELKFRESKK